MKRRREGRLIGELVILGQTMVRGNVRKVRAGCKAGRGEPDELEGVGEALSCSFEPVHTKI